MGRVTRRTPARQIRLSAEQAVTVSTRPETLAVEEPLEIRVDGRALTVTMRTPGDDFDLALGLLLTEGVVTRASDVRRSMHCLDAGEDGRPTYNVVDVTLAADVPALPASSQHPLLTTSACGVCGKASIDAIRLRSRYAVRDDPQSLSPQLLASLPDRLRSRQKVFDRTGGLHAAGLFTAEGELLAVREDVGRHNAVDKVIGWALRQERLPLTGHVLCVSGRASFELTQKALMAGLPTLVAVSAPSSLAVELAAETGMTLVGFARGQRLTVYAGSQRVVIPDEQRDHAAG
ncbi:MAG TPA: formate dehydrogenase accessory sulfurtransferase FdhD [Segeticoccus sp.]|uniref:formate dehydrogenase accessory sulfurtransferase FdhD n=1 Tax=Segeticoccus sp. TaxID=2706531 RepID=UPI002D7F3A2C|nr:formate dehydrogenase accessory sulfurtransferase FdhD [Segeticoccus sp.]HET8602269.1 formate dehydrogenase accessory sulfurtransferase FdhD [Segeticoccus sp.]